MLRTVSMTGAVPRTAIDSCRVSKTYWPERLELVESLPHTPSGKIQKFLLRAQARELVTT